MQSYSTPAYFSGSMIENSFNIRDKQRVMDELPVIGYPCLRDELWDRQGANIASR